jgi:hypothetical protein
MKGLIKLAAAGVKASEGRPAGVRQHARRAAELLAAAKSQGASGFGVSIDDLHAAAERIAADGNFTAPRILLTPDS